MISIRRVLVRELMLLVGVTILVLVAGSGYGLVKGIDSQGDLRAKELFASVSQELADHFADAEQVGLAMKGWWSDGLLDLARPEDVERLAVPVLQQHPEVSSAFIVDTTGRSVMLSRVLGDPGETLPGWGTLVIEVRNGALVQWSNFPLPESGTTRQRPKPAFLDPRTRPWFRLGMASAAPRWTDPYNFFRSERPGLSFIVPLIRRDGEHAGVICIDLLLDRVSDRLWKMALTPGSQSILLDRRNRVISFPRQAGFDTVEARQSAFLNVLSPAFLGKFHALATKWPNLDSTSPEPVHFFHRGRREVGLMRRLSSEPGKDLTLAFITPWAELLTPVVGRLAFMAVLTLLGLGLVFWRIVQLSRRLGDPLSRLAESARALSTGGIPDPPPSGILELRSLGEALRAAGEDLAAHDLERRKSEHSERLQTVGTLAGGIAHDANNQLHAILGQIELTRTFLGPDHPAMIRLGRAEEAAKRCARTIQGLLAFTHNLPPEVRPLDLNALVKDTGELLDRVLGGLITLQMELAPDLPPVLADSVGLEQVLMNLAVNARDAMPKGGQLWIRTRPRQDGSVLLEVADTGDGIPPEHLPKIFEPFFTTKEIGKGTGLGLAMVHGIVQSHQGTITVDSAPGAGTRIQVALPGRPDLTGPAEPAAAPQAPAPNLAGKRILVVDDEPLIRDTLAELLVRARAQVETARDGEEAWALWKDGRYHLLVADQRMPRCTGLELVSRIRAQGSLAPVLLISGYGLEGLREHLDGDPHLQVLVKPFEHSQFHARVARLLGSE